MNRKKCNANGFTMIEILIVISIIAILIALILPFMKMSKEAARRAQCASRTRQVTHGALSYAIDHKNEVAPHGWIVKHPTLFKFNGNLEDGGWNLTQIYEQYINNMEIWTCPSADVPPVNDPSNDTARGPMAPQYMSYGYMPGRDQYPHFGDPQKAVPLNIGRAEPTQVMIQDNLLLRQNNYQYEVGWWANHAQRDAIKFAHANPSSGTWIVQIVEGKNQSAGANLALYDGSTKWYDVNALENVGLDDHGSNGADFYSLKQWDN